MGIEREGENRKNKVNIFSHQTNKIILLYFMKI